MFKENEKLVRIKDKLLWIEKNKTVYKIGKWSGWMNFGVHNFKFLLYLKMGESWIVRMIELEVKVIDIWY